MNNQPNHSVINPGGDENQILLSESTNALIKFLSTIQQLQVENADFKSIIQKFKKDFNGVNFDDWIFKLTNNRTVPDPDSKSWKKIHRQISDNMKIKIKHEEDDVVEVQANTLFAPSVNGNGMQIRNQQMTHNTSSTSSICKVVIPTTTLETSHHNSTIPFDENSNSPNLLLSPHQKSLFNVVDTRNNVAPNSSTIMDGRIVSINIKATQQQKKSSQSSSSDKSNEGKKKRKTPERAAKSKAKIRLNEHSIDESESDSECSSGDESIDLIPPKVVKTKKRQSPKKKTTDTPQTVQEKEEIRMKNLLQSWKLTLNFLKNEREIPNIDTIKHQLKTASIKSSQATGFNYAKIVQKTIPKNVLKLWKDYPLTFFMISYKIMQEVPSIVKVITTLLEEDQVLGTFFKRKPYPNCPDYDKLHKLLD